RRRTRARYRPRTSPLLEHVHYEASRSLLKAIVPRLMSFRIEEWKTIGGIAMRKVTGTTTFILAGPEDARKRPSVFEPRCLFPKRCPYRSEAPDAGKRPMS